MIFIPIIMACTSFNANILSQGLHCLHKYNKSLFSDSDDSSYIN